MINNKEAINKYKEIRKRALRYRDMLLMQHPILKNDVEEYNNIIDYYSLKINQLSITKRA